MEKLKVGMVGFGARGMVLLNDILLPMSGDVEVTAVCDVYEDRAASAAESVLQVYGKSPLIFTDYQKLLESGNVNTVVITSSWETHIPFAIMAMKAKKPCGVEVGGAYSIKQCWDLIHTYEETKTPVMMLENCCYGRRELMALHMAESGAFGKVVHCSGGYHHDLRSEIAFGEENRHYRLRNYKNRNCENYPTHELGPIAKLLCINDGNRMLSLTSTASQSFGLHEFAADRKPEDEELLNTRFAQGDIVTTVIRLSGGETITLTLDTTLPRYYTRGFTVRGTRGMYEEITDSIFLDTEEDQKYDFKWKEQWGNASRYEEQYEHPIWRKYLKEGVKGSHDGMDWLVFSAFFDSLRTHTPCPIDVYDMAAWMSISALSEKSIALCGQPVEVPDFTSGRWQR